MKKTRVTVTHAVLLELLIVGLFVWAAFGLPGCAALDSAIPTVTELAVLECRHYVDTHPDQHIPQSLCDNAGNLWLDVVTLVDAKPSVGAVKEALVAHPPIESVLPCSVIAPHIEPQSRIERKLYPFVVEPPARGE